MKKKVFSNSDETLFIIIKSNEGNFSTTSPFLGEVVENPPLQLVVGEPKNVKKLQENLLQNIRTTYRLWIYTRDANHYGIY